MIIDGREIAPSLPAYVIAEVGHNHQGNVDLCKKLILAAKNAGADAVKLQKRSNHTLFTEEAFNAPYENPNSFGQTYGEHRSALEFGEKEYSQLKEYSTDVGISFFATAFDIDSADFLDSLGVPAFKIASGDLKNIPLIEHVAAMGKPTIISTGGAEIKDVERAYEAFLKINSDLALLQCTAAYPAQPDDLNLGVIPEYKRRFPHAVVGYSGHENGICMPVVAQTMGAEIIEKHFTLDRTMKGTDHVFSLNPDGLRRLVRDLNRAKRAVGSNQKQRLEVEEQAIKKMGKQLVAAENLTQGQVLTRDLIGIKSPGGGTEPYHINEFVGQRIRKTLKKDEPLKIQDLD